MARGSLVRDDAAGLAPGVRALVGARSGRLRGGDYALIVAFCWLLYGFSAFADRPLSMHEARLPECSREMMANHDWLVPRSGGRPWLERPPLPHWVEVATSAVMGRRCEDVWAVRLPAAGMGIATVVLTAWVAGRLFGRGFGMVSGLALATMYEFYAYSCLAEDDIFLAALVAVAMTLFVRAEFIEGPAPMEGKWRPFGGRSLAVAGFFVVTGVSAIAKGPLLGALVIAPTAAAYLAWDGGWRRVRRYVWVWGWVACAVLTLAWPAYIYHRYPDVMENWLLDYSRTSKYDEPIWYYGPQLLLGLLPWTPAALFGLGSLVRKAWRRELAPAERLVLCWAVLPVVMLSLQHRKHHHYLVPSIAPWGLVAAYGLFTAVPALYRAAAKSPRPIVDALAAIGGAVALWVLRGKIPGPAWAHVLLVVTWVACVGIWYLGVRRQDGRLSMAAVLLGTMVVYGWGQTCLPNGVDADTAFLRRVEASVPQDALLTVNSDLRGDMDFFRNCFYLRRDAVLIHNLSFLRDEKIHEPAVYVVTRARDGADLRELGTVEQVDQSAKTRRETSPADRFALFRVTFRPDLTRYPAPAPDTVTTIQAMDRKPGPYCGPAWPVTGAAASRRDQDD